MASLSERVDPGRFLRARGHSQTGRILLAVGIVQRLIPVRASRTKGRRRVSGNVGGHRFEQRRQPWPQPFRGRETPFEKMTEKRVHRLISSR
jgi:hypothetical protein